MAGGGAIRLLSISFNRDVKIMTINEQVKNNMTYLYIKDLEENRYAAAI